MSATIGLAGPPRFVRELLVEAAENLAAAATELDALVVHGSQAALGAIETCEDEGDRILHDLFTAVRGGRLVGPDRELFVTLGQAVDDVLDAVDEVAWCWDRRPLGPAADALLPLRDTVRASARAARHADDPTAREQRIARSREMHTDARGCLRDARRRLLVEQDDPQVALAGDALLRRVESASLPPGAFESGSSATSCRCRHRHRRHRRSRRPRRRSRDRCVDEPSALLRAGAGRRRVEPVLDLRRRAVAGHRSRRSRLPARSRRAAPAGPSAQRRRAGRGPAWTAGARAGLTPKRRASVVQRHRSRLSQIPSRTLATVSHASTAASSVSKMSFQRITVMGSMPMANSDVTAERTS